MQPSTFYFYTVSLLILVGGSFAYYSDYSDVEGLRLNLMDPEGGNKTEKAMHQFNQRLDETVEKVNKLYEEALKTELPNRLAKIESAVKSPKLTDAQWEAIKEKRRKAARERLYREISHKVFRDYGNFSTVGGQTFFDINDENIFAAPEGYYREEV